MTTTTTAPVLSPEDLSKISALATVEERRKFLADRKSLVQADVVAELNAATLQEFRINTTTALALADAAILIANILCRLELLAQSKRIKAHVLSERGEYQTAVALYDEAEKLFEQAKDQEGVGRTVTAAIHPRIMIGDYDGAFALATRAQDIFSAMGDQRRLARLGNNIGNIFHRQDRFQEALTHYEGAYQQLLPYGDAEELTISLNNMSMCLISLNDFAKALATYERAKYLLLDHDIPLIHLTTDYNIAYLYYLRGDYRRAIEGLKSARLAGDKIGDKYLVALCYLDLSDIYVELNLSSEVHDIAHHGYQLFREMEIGYEAAKTLVNQAIAFGQEGKTAKSLETFGEAKRLFIKEKNEVWQWLIDLYQAIVLFSAGRYYEARHFATGAANYFDGSLLRNKAAICHFLLAQTAIHTGDLTTARNECLAGLEIVKKLDSPILQYQARFLLGRIDQAAGSYASAYLQYQQARHSLEGLRSNLYRDELKISFMKNKSELYERMVELCINPDFDEGTEEEAFKYIELAKSRNLSELMFQRGHNAPVPKLGQSELVHKIRELREELNWYQHRIELEQLRSAGNVAETIESLRQKATEKEKTLLAILADLPQGSLEASAIAPASCATVDTVQSVLPADTTLLEYYFAGDYIVAAVVSRHSFHIAHVTTVARVSESLRFFRFQLGRLHLSAHLGPGSAKDMYDSTVAHLAELHKELIDPVAQYLQTRHLVVVPHGKLHYLPFHALYDGGKFLIDVHDISYAPSATVFALCHRPYEGTASGSAIFGIPDEKAPLIQDEVDAVHRTLPDSELFLGPAATHEKLVEKGVDSRVIHIATHGSFRPDNPMFSGIALGDGYLNLYELYQMRLNAELLAFSGCATGLNVVSAGDELLGLVRGALYAGARSLLLTLWDVNDASTNKFMSAFYRRFQTGENKATAAAEAAKEIRQEYPHPYYWAPFTIVGKT
ncbi:MAG TPA: CHAT domain-containing protein [Candidatus Acidoferrum sp.]|nr:CHAT domain-containing protein [Candidatus Acidoferrum sp.]